MHEGNAETEMLSTSEAGRERMRNPTRSLITKVLLSTGLPPPLLTTVACSHERCCLSFHGQLSTREGSLAVETTRLWVEERERGARNEAAK